MVKQRGFTLVEIAIVIAIGALLLGYALSVLTAQLTNTRIKTTQNQSQVIKTALTTYLATNNRLPCPAVENLPDTNANYGVEDDPTVGCMGTTAMLDGGGVTVARRGIVPWATLGLADTATLDGWNRRYTYVVTTCLVNVDPAACAPTTSTSQTSLVSQDTQVPGQRITPTMWGNLTVHRATPINDTNPTPAAQTQITICDPNNPVDNSCNFFPVVMLVSHGNNGFGAFLPGSGNRVLPLPVGLNESENTDLDTAFTRMDWIDNAAAAGGVYDDIVLWLRPADLLRPLEVNGNTPASAQVVLTERFDRIEKSLLGSIVLDVGDPDAAGPRIHTHRVPFADTDGNGTSDAPGLNGTVPFVDLRMGASDVLDPWGQAIRYQTFLNVTANNATGGVWSGSPDLPPPTGIGSGTAYTLTSLGPDGVAPSADDVQVTRPILDLVGTMTAAGVPE